MKESEITDIFNQLKDFDKETISSRIKKDIETKSSTPSPGVMGGGLGGLLLGGAICGCAGAAIAGAAIGPKQDNPEDTYNRAMDGCKQQLKNPVISEKVKNLLKDNTKTVNCTLEIIQLVAPAVAQIYGGLSAMTIVGSLMILCKQGINNYLS